MNDFISLLRGINVGGKTIKMEILKGLYESLGFYDVKTHIQSGNVLFNAKSKKIGRGKWRLIVSSGQSVKRASISAKCFSGSATVIV